MACELEDGEPIVSIPGCTDPLALNYFSGATVDNGSCVYPQPVSGCTDPFAINYNNEAIIEDCSCIYTDCPDTIYISDDGFVLYTVESVTPIKPLLPISKKNEIRLPVRSVPLSEDCCTEEVVGQPVTWDGKRCRLTDRIGCPEEIVIGDDNVVYYSKPIEEAINNDFVTKRFIGARRILLNRNCCKESVVGQPVTWDPNFVINGNKEPGACILDNPPEVCELSLEDVIYVGDTVVINCLIPPIEEEVPDDIDDSGIIDDTKGCIDIQQINISTPESLFDSPNGIVPHVTLVTSDVNVLTYQVGDVLELNGFGVINNTCFNNIDINGQAEILFIQDLTSFNGFYYIWLNVTTVLGNGCIQNDLTVNTNGVACPIEGVDVGDPPTTCVNIISWFNELIGSNITEQEASDNDIPLNTGGGILTDPTLNLRIPLGQSDGVNALVNDGVGDDLYLSNITPLTNNDCYGTIDLNGVTVKVLKKIPDQNNPSNIILVTDYILIPNLGTCNNSSYEIIEDDATGCPFGGKSINKSNLQDTTTNTKIDTNKEDVFYTEGIVLTYQQDSPTQCGEYYTNSNIDLDPFIFNNTIKNTILELNYNVGNQNCCNGYFQITITGPNNFQETIQSNQKTQIILPITGEYEITLDLVYFNCSSSLSVISKTPQEKFLSSINNSINNLIELIGGIPVLLDPCNPILDGPQPIECPNLSEFCCTTLGANLGWAFIDGVCYWNPPAQPTQIEIGVSENDIFVPDSGCTDLNVSLFFYMEKPDVQECLNTENITATLAFYSGDSMTNDNIFNTIELSNFDLGRDGYCNWVKIESDILGYSGENFKIKLILNNVLECCNYNIFVDDIKVDCVLQDTILVTNKFDCPGFKLDRVIDNKKSWVYNDGDVVNRIFAPSPDADLPWRYTDYLEQSGVYEKHSKLVLNSKEMEITFNMCNTDNCTPVLNIFELIDYKKNFQSFWIKFIEQFVPATTIFVAGEKWCTKSEDICPVYDVCDYDNHFELKDLGVIQLNSQPIKPTPSLSGQEVGVSKGNNTPVNIKIGDFGKNDKSNGEPLILDGFIGSFIEDNSYDIREKLTFKRGELPLLKDGMRNYISKFSKPTQQILK